jgi:predicted Zn-dependent protease
VKELTEGLLDKAANAGVRVEETEGTTIRMVAPTEADIRAFREAGYSVRLLVHGACGFAAGQETDHAGTHDVVTRAVSMARSGSPG